jgi:hypothetical protein
MKRIFGAILACAGIFAAGSAFATPVSQSFNLTCPLNGGQCGATVFGTVTLQQSGTSVIVSETLANPYVFAATGAGDALVFSLSSTRTGVTLSNITAGFEVVQSPKGVPYGTFGFGVDYTSVHGAHSTNATSFSFTVSAGNGVSVSDFILNDAQYYFASDIGIPAGGGSYTTGNVASQGSGVSSVPEPAAVALLGMGFLMLGLVRRRLVPARAKRNRAR